VIWGRCYDHNFLRFSAKKIGVFLKNQCYDNFLCKITFCLSQKRQFFSLNISARYLKNHNIGLRLGEFSPNELLFALGIFLENYTKSPTVWVYFFPLCINYDKNGLGYVLGDVFTNSYGHPGQYE
jgi:hypothetical protein